MKKYFTKFDVVLMIAILLIATTALAVINKTKTVFSSNIRINLDGKITTYNLNINKKIKLSNGKYKAVVEIKNKQVRIKEINCPDQICKRKGWISTSGSSIICAPMKLAVTIKGINKGRLDALNR